MSQYVAGVGVMKHGCGGFIVELRIVRGRLQQYSAKVSSDGRSWPHEATLTGADCKVLPEVVWFKYGNEKKRKRQGRVNRARHWLSCSLFVLAWKKIG